jgi:SAM-dependent methyltransferase
MKVTAQFRDEPSIDGAPDLDEAFDAAFPEWIRAQSERHWTPVRVARRAAELLVTSQQTRVLDVGSGSGKLCIVGALTCGRGCFHGIEQREDLVKVAQETARRLEIEDRVQFLHGDATALDWSEFHAFYFYNPFVEVVDGPASRSSAVVPRTRKVPSGLNQHYLRVARTRLAKCPAGTRVVTYYGFGDRLPSSYRRVRREPHGVGVLELWIKDLMRPARTAGRDTGPAASCRTGCRPLTAHR